MKKRLAAIIFLLVANPTQAQHHVIGATVGYKAQSGHWLQAGLDYQWVNTNNWAIGADLTANAIYSQDKIKVVPEATLSLYPNANKLFAPYIASGISPYTITPKLGFSLAYMLNLEFGYGFSIQENSDYIKPISGFSFGLKVRYPLNYKWSF